MSQKANSYQLKRKLKFIYYISTPILGIVFILISQIVNNIILKNTFSNIGAAFLGAAIILILERLIIGNPLDDIYEANQLILDASTCGLKRIILDRNSFFAGEGVTNLIRDENISIKIQGIALGFLVYNRKIIDLLYEKAKHGVKISFILSHPNSEILKMRDQEEEWNGTLKSRLKTTLDILIKLKTNYSNTVSLKLFMGEIHNTIISTSQTIVISPYIFGKKGWFAPAFLFSRVNETIISTYEGQFSEIERFSKINPQFLFEVQDESCLKRLLSSN